MRPDSNTIVRASALSPPASSWWLDLDRVSLRAAVERERARMAGTKFGLIVSSGITGRDDPARSAARYRQAREGLI